MSDQFYSYLAEKTINFFKENPLTAGAKFNIQFETENQVRGLYEALKENTLREKFDYKDNNGEIQYQSYSLKFDNGKELIVSSTMDNVQPDFLTRLRNLVGVENGYENKGILFIHNTELDSIMGGTESFMKEGMPFHIDSIQKDITAKLGVKSGFTDSEKAIIENDLDRKKEFLSQESLSVFEYKEILDITNKGTIEKNEYKNFGLFYDSKMDGLEGKNLKKRLKENTKLFEKVEEVHTYGDPTEDLEKFFDNRGVDKLKKEDWREIDFKEVERSAEAKKSTKPLEYEGCSEEWDIAEGNSKAKARIRNIIIFNEEGLEDIDLEIKFDESLKKGNVNVGKDPGVEAITAGKKLKLKLKDMDGRPDFYKVSYKDEKGTKFDFKILILRCKSKYLESIKSKFSLVIKKKNSYISIKTNETKINFNEFGEKVLEYSIERNNETVEVNKDTRVTVSIHDNFKYTDDNDLIEFKLVLDDEIVPCGIIGTNEKPGPIEGLKVWKRKNRSESSFRLMTETKLIHGTKEYFVRDEFRRNLALEKKIIEEEGIYFEEFNEGLQNVYVEIPSELEKAYKNIIQIYKNKNSVPSLYYLDAEMKVAYTEYLKAFLKELEGISEGEYVDRQKKNLFKVGTVRRFIEDRELLFTPLHPINVAYQLSIIDSLAEKLVDEVIKKFNGTYLLPYISIDERLYIPIEQNHSPEWKVYVDEKLPRYRGSRDFVSKLVNEKIKEFVDHFKYLFNMGNNAPIKINLYNTGDSKEILQGVFKYYVTKLKNSEIENVIPMDIYIYSDKQITNAFEEVAFNDDLENLKDTYGLDLKVDGLTEEDVIDIYRDKVKFYSKGLEERMEYSHITFIEMRNEARTIKANMNDIPSGAILNGQISGVPSVFLGDSYRTGFGTKFANNENILMRVASGLNALNAAVSGDPYKKNECSAISVSNSSKERLEDIYNTSHWVTFINPKVDLNFFKNDPEAKDLLIIHYSDQYTTAGGYDAITVTRRSDPYKRVIEEFLGKYGIENAEEYSPKVINTFNAVNGDWLLKLLSSKSYAPKEKISILSAIKLVLAKFENENIIWVPISLEEVLRVSGGAGLKQTEGLFTAKSLNIQGSTSDDILMVGIEEKAGETKVYYYPIEVKIGGNNKGYLEKGKYQVIQTKDAFKKYLLPDEEGNISTMTKVYRNFLMQLVITSAEKLELYAVSDKSNWRKIINSDLRRKLLNEEYKISEDLEKTIGQAAVLSFKDDCERETFELDNEIGLIELNSKYGIELVTREISEIEKLVKKVKVTSSQDQGDSLGGDESGFDSVEDIDNKPEAEPMGPITSYPSPPEVFPEEYGVAEPVVEPVADVPVIVEKNIEVLFGINEKNNSKVIWYPNDTNKLMHTNTGIIGTMGTGKTQFTKSLITQLYREAKYNVDSEELGILIFDYKGDYNKNKQDFIDATNANVYELHQLPFNPLSITQGKNSKNMLPLHIASSLRETLTKAFNLGVKQSNLLKTVIMEAYEKRGINKADKDTWNKPAPTLKDVYDIYVDREDFKEDSLYAAFSELIDFEIFEPNPFQTKGLFEILNGVTVIDLSGYDEGIQNLVVAITLDLFYAQMQAKGHSKIEGHLRQLNKMILVDEADNFLSKDFPSLRKILKEGREFGVGTILSTQLLSHFSTGENEYANYILSWIIHRVDDLNLREVKKIFNTQNKVDEEYLFNKIKSLKKHHSVVKLGDSDREIYMRDKAFWELDK